MKIRILTKADTPALLLLLAEGFPRRSTDYWSRAVNALSMREGIPEDLRYGWGLEADGALQGVLLLIASPAGGRPRVNLSSWYVRPAFRTGALLMLRRALKDRSVTYTDLSPAPNVAALNEMLGFVPYTAGMVMLTPRDALRRGGNVRSYGGTGIDAANKALIEAHVRFGNSALLVDGAPALYRVKWLKKAVPAAQFTFGDPRILVGNAGALMRHLLGRGMPVALVDLPPGYVPLCGRAMTGRQVRFALGPDVPAAGDLSETEIAIFGP